MRRVNSFASLLFLIVALCHSEAQAQFANDTVIVANNFSKYIGLTCILREDLIKAVANGDTTTIRNFRNATVVLSTSEEVTIKGKLLTYRERRMLQFYFGEYDKLLSGIEMDRDYFFCENNVEIGHDYPNFECGNLTLAMLTFWKGQTEKIINQIQQSSISTQEKDLLIFYWEAILLYIEGDTTISADFNKKAAEYLEKYSNTKYRSYIERLATMKRIYQPNGMTLGLGFGQSLLNGPIDKYLNGNLVFDAEVGYTFNAWKIGLGYRLREFRNKDTMRLERIDTLKITQSSFIEYHGAFLKVGYTVLDKGWFYLQPFISGELNNLVNYIDLPDTTGIRQRGRTHPKIGFGAEGAIRLTKNLVKVDDTQFIYYPREEKDRLYSPVFLNFRIYYYPRVFDKPTDISGGILCITAGLEWIVGRNKVNYRYKK